VLRPPGGRPPPGRRAGAAADRRTGATLTRIAPSRIHAGREGSVLLRLDLKNNRIKKRSSPRFCLCLPLSACSVSLCALCWLAFSGAAGIAPEGFKIHDARRRGRRVRAKMRATETEPDLKGNRGESGSSRRAPRTAGLAGGVPPPPRPKPSWGPVPTAAAAPSPGGPRWVGCTLAHGVKSVTFRVLVCAANRKTPRNPATGSGERAPYALPCGVPTPKICLTRVRAGR
jgi:hypothetical protein